ncbi:hypothetical protein [Fulvivirga aurantia]|uniref:hypothetical protein n=1 Tax=Fulvivirga aurantia TaxID=2529383 RepID=UPI0012BC230C|nr:hypothetical protein [Fulvivirga aurantia]
MVDFSLEDDSFSILLGGGGFTGVVCSVLGLLSASSFPASLFGVGEVFFSAAEDG